MLVPSMLYALMDHPDSHTRDLSSLETVYYGASAINPVRLKEAIERFGPIFAQYYGQSEAPMAISYLSREDHAEALADGGDERRLASCGRPSAFVPRRSGTAGCTPATWPARTRTASGSSSTGPRT
jgi:fatty-acyl-CoA synthase